MENNRPNPFICDEMKQKRSLLMIIFSGASFTWNLVRHAGRTKPKCPSLVFLWATLLAGTLAYRPPSIPSCKVALTSLSRSLTAFFAYESSVPRVGMFRIENALSTVANHYLRCSHVVFATVTTRTLFATCTACREYMFTREQRMISEKMRCPIGSLRLSQMRRSNRL